jgi:hypothetical protein
MTLPAPRGAAVEDLIRFGLVEEKLSRLRLVGKSHAIQALMDIPMFAAAEVQVVLILMTLSTSKGTAVVKFAEVLKSGKKNAPFFPGP